MNLNVLVMSNGAVQKGLGGVFDCLFTEGFERVYRVGLDDALEQYRETVGDWDIVIIDQDGPLAIRESLAAISNHNPKPHIVVVTDDGGRMYEHTNCVRRNGSELASALKQLSFRIRSASLSE